eukprot:10782185-Alexandrium_andersonii.AAC.1
MPRSPRLRRRTAAGRHQQQQGQHFRLAFLATVRAPAMTSTWHQTRSKMGQPAPAESALRRSPLEQHSLAPTPPATCECASRGRLHQSQLACHAQARGS